MEIDLTLQARLLGINATKKIDDIRQSFTDIQARFNGDLTRTIAVVSIDIQREIILGKLRQHDLRLKLIILPDKVYQWLSAFIPSKTYHGALKDRLEDTGLWFTNGARFAQWKETADDFLWISGARMYSYHLRVFIYTESL